VECASCGEPYESTNPSWQFWYGLDGRLVKAFCPEHTKDFIIGGWHEFRAPVCECFCLHCKSGRHRLCTRGCPG
jgi:hypothetical protein